MSEPGHNSSQQLKSIVERVERLGMEIKGLQSDQKDIFAEAKSQGWDVKALRMILRMRQQDPDERHNARLIVCSPLSGRCGDPAVECGRNFGVR